MKRLDLLDYEIRSSLWACYVSNDYLQKLAVKYFSWKVKKKHKRYLRSLAGRDWVKSKYEDF